MNRAEACSLGVELFNGAGTADLVTAGVLVVLLPAVLALMVVHRWPHIVGFTSGDLDRMRGREDSRRRSRALRKHRRDAAKARQDNRPPWSAAWKRSLRKRERGGALFGFVLVLNAVVLLAFLFLVLSAAP